MFDSIRRYTDVLPTRLRSILTVLLALPVLYALYFHELTGVGMVDPDEGKSYLQLAMAGRSLHRSQDMGQIQRLGASSLRLRLIARADGRTGPDGGLPTAPASRRRCAS